MITENSLSIDDVLREFIAQDDRTRIRFSDKRIIPFEDGLQALVFPLHHRPLIEVEDRTQPHGYEMPVPADASELWIITHNEIVIAFGISKPSDLARQLAVTRRIYADFAKNFAKNSTEVS